MPIPRKPANPRINNQTTSETRTSAGAPASVSGVEGISGASPSNTAPHNSNTSLPDGFRLLRLAVDSLYLSYPGELDNAAYSALQRLKAYAQSEHLEQVANAQYSLGAHIFEVKDRGTGMFPFILVDNAYRIQLSRPGKKLPMAYVQVSAEYLAHKSPKEVQDELQALLTELGTLSGHSVVSRIDLAADFSTPVVMDSWHRSAWVTRAMEIHSYAKDQVFTGWTIGMGGVIGCRLYNKIKETIHSGKAWAMNLWTPMGWQPGEDVWRLEFEFKRDFLKERGLGSLDTVLDNLNGLWAYATTEWLRLTVPNEADATRSRWPTHHLWVALASVNWDAPPGATLDKYSNARTPTELRLITVVLGALTSYMAMHKLDNRAEAIDQLIARLYEHYSSVADKKGLNFDEYLAQRIAAKGREFNTAVNSPGLVDNLKQDFRDEGAEAYRRASKGLRDQQWKTKACLCHLCVVYPRNKRLSTWGLEPPSLPSWVCPSFAWVGAVFMTGLTWIPGSKTLRRSEGGPERRTYGP